MAWHLYCWAARILLEDQERCSCGSPTVRKRMHAYNCTSMRRPQLLLPSCNRYTVQYCVVPTYQSTCQDEEERTEVYAVPYKLQLSLSSALIDVSCMFYDDVHVVRTIRADCCIVYKVAAHPAPQLQASSCVRGTVAQVRSIAMPHASTICLAKSHSGGCVVQSRERHISYCASIW